MVVEMVGKPLGWPPPSLERDNRVLRHAGEHLDRADVREQRFVQRASALPARAVWHAFDGEVAREGEQGAFPTVRGRVRVSHVHAA